MSGHLKEIQSALLKINPTYDFKTLKSPSSWALFGLFLIILVCEGFLFYKPTIISAFSFIASLVITTIYMVVFERIIKPSLIKKNHNMLFYLPSSKGG